MKTVHINLECKADHLIQDLRDLANFLEDSDLNMEEISAIDGNGFTGELSVTER